MSEQSKPNVEPESFGDRLKHLLAAGSHHVFLAPAALAGALRAAPEEHGEEVEIGLEHHWSIESASFSFQLAAYSRPVGR